jgi:hypothetical protein
MIPEKPPCVSFVRVVLDDDSEVLDLVLEHLGQAGQGLIH